MSNKLTEKYIDAKIEGAVRATADHFNKTTEELKADNAKLREYIKQSSDENAKAAFARGDSTFMRSVRGESPEETLEKIRAASSIKMVGSGIGRAPIRAGDEAGIHATRFIRALIWGEKHNRDPMELARQWEDKILQAHLEENAALRQGLTGSGSERAAAQRALGAEHLGSGGALVHTSLASQIIALLSSSTVMRRMGVPVMPLLSGKTRLPFIQEGVVAEYGKECSGPNATAPKFGELYAENRYLRVLICMCNQWLEDSSYAIEPLMRDEIIRAITLKEDQAFLRGDGLESSPFGLSYFADLANNVELASNISGLAPVDKIQTIMDDLVKMIACVACGDVPESRRGWIMHCRTKHALMRCLDGNGNRVFFDELVNDRLLGYPVFETTHIPTNLDASGAGNDNETELYFADAGHLMIFENGSLEVQLFRDATVRGAKGQTIHGINDEVTVMRGRMVHDFLASKRGAEVCKLEGVAWALQN